MKRDTSLYNSSKIWPRILPGLYIICYICGIGSEYDRTSLLLAEAETATPLSRSAPNADRSREAREVERDTSLYNSSRIRPRLAERACILCEVSIANATEFLCFLPKLRT